MEVKHMPRIPPKNAGTPGMAIEPFDWESEMVEWSGKVIQSSERMKDIKSRVRADAQAYQLTPQEIDELQGAYVEEQTNQPARNFQNNMNDTLSYILGERPRQRSSAEILEGARQRMQRGGSVSPTQPQGGAVSPSLLDYYNRKK